MALLTRSFHRRGAAAREHQTKSRFRKVDDYHQRYSSLYQSSIIEISRINHIYSFFLSSSSLSSTYIIPISSTMSHISLASDDSDVFYVEQSSTEPSPKKDTILQINSTQPSYRSTTQHGCPQCRL